MKIIVPSVELMSPIRPNVLVFLEKCGRVCYKSEAKTSHDSCKKFIKNIIERGHESVLEHYSVTVKFITDRGVSHEIVRHRIASFSQESTRYCNYKDQEIQFTDPYAVTDHTIAKPLSNYHKYLALSEKAYKELIRKGSSPQMARAILPNALKTEIIMTANLREWRHFLRLRTSNAAHPQMRQVAIPLLKFLQRRIPVVFDDIMRGEYPNLPMATVKDSRYRGK